LILFFNNYSSLRKIPFSFHCLNYFKAAALFHATELEQGFLLCIEVLTPLVVAAVADEGNVLTSGQVVVTR